MHRVYRSTDITLESLKDYPAEQVRSGIPADSPSEAAAIVRRLRGLATVCPTPTPTPTPARTPTTTPTPTKKGATKAPSPTRAPSPSPNPSPTLQPPQCI